MLKNKYLWICLLFLGLQQIIVGASTLWIGYLGESIANNSVDLVYLILFLSSLILVYIPGGISLVYLEKAKLLWFRNYISSFTKKYKGMSIIHSSSEDRLQLEPWITSEGYITFQELGSFVYSFLSTFLNSFVSILALSYILDMGFMLAYFLCFLVLFSLIFLSRNLISESTEKVQKSRKGLNHFLGSGWDNIVIGNIYSLKIWNNLFFSRMTDHESSSTSQSCLKQIISSSSMVLSLIPVFYIIWEKFSGSFSMTSLTILLATLPRQVQIVQSLYSFALGIVDAKEISTKVKLLQRSLKKMTIDESVSRIDLDKMTIEKDGVHEKFKDIVEFEEYLLKNERGRITVRGDNGSGKSTLKKYIKYRMPEKTFYLPSSSKLSFHSLKDKSLSTGQSILKSLTEISSKVHSDIILLDEWDANLDEKNIQRCHNLINQMSLKCLVIETRHRL
jgi:ABC-type bacteriocin/lantibiotic exporter with double-glycine peptidase domain